MVQWVHRQFRILGQIVGIFAHDHFLHFRVLLYGQHPLVDVSRCDYRFCPAVRKDLQKLPFGKHWIDRHHHGIGPQNSEKSDSKMRGVLHVQGHPITFCHARIREHGRGSFDRIRHVAICDRFAVINYGRIIRIPARRCFQEFKKRDLRQFEFIRKPVRPESKMCGVFHHVLPG